MRNLLPLLSLSITATLFAAEPAQAPDAPSGAEAAIDRNEILPPVSTRISKKKRLNGLLTFVVIQQYKTDLVSNLVISKLRTAPHIKYANIKIQAFDDMGETVPLDYNPKVQKSFVEAGGFDHLSAFGSYIAKPKSGRIIRIVKVEMEGDAQTFFIPLEEAK